MGGPPNLGQPSDKQAAGMVFSTMDQDYPKYPVASGGVGTSSAFPTQTDRWQGYEEIDVPERERGWMPKQRTTLETQRRARQKKNQHDVVVGSKVGRRSASVDSPMRCWQLALSPPDSVLFAADAQWLKDGPAEPRNRVGPLKPHTVMVTARKKEPTPIEPRFVQSTDENWGGDVHYEDGSGSGMGGFISRTASLDYGSFTLPQKSRKGATTGLLVPYAAPGHLTICYSSPLPTC
jgi:hypothetical protein